jgi:hypothetical protein
MKVSPTLQGEVATGMHGHWMSTVKYFQGADSKTGESWAISERFKVQVALSITSAVYAPFEPIYGAHDVSVGLMVGLTTNTVTHTVVSCDFSVISHTGCEMQTCDWLNTPIPYVSRLRRMLITFTKP